MGARDDCSEREVEGLCVKEARPLTVVWGVRGGVCLRMKKGELASSSRRRRPDERAAPADADGACLSTTDHARTAATATH
jgi:hypothetical protein